MASADELVLAVHAAADTVVANPAIDLAKRQAIQAALGTPGATVTIANQRFHSGSALSPVPTANSVIIQGIGDWLDIEKVPDIRAKLNELIAAYNQLRADFISGGGSTTAPVVAEL